MSALIIRLPEEKRTRLKLVAKSRKMSVTKLIEEMATILLADFDAETRFELRAARGRGRNRGGSRAVGKSGGKTSPLEAKLINMRSPDGLLRGLWPFVLRFAADRRRALRGSAQLGRGRPSCRTRLVCLSGVRREHARQPFPTNGPHPMT